VATAKSGGESCGFSSHHRGCDYCDGSCGFDKHAGGRIGDCSCRVDDSSCRVDGPPDLFITDLPLCAIRLVLICVLKLGRNILKCAGICAKSFGFVQAKLAEAIFRGKGNFFDGNSQPSCNDRVVASQN